MRGAGHVGGRGLAWFRLAALRMENGLNLEHDFQIENKGLAGGVNSIPSKASDSLLPRDFHAGSGSKLLLASLTTL